MKIKKWAKRIGLGLLSVLLIAILMGVIYEQVERKKARKYIESRKGAFVDVGDYQLYYEKEGTGSPTVIFESGFPGDHRAWINSYVRKELSKQATTLIYDRPGLLWSGGGDRPQTAETLSNDLYQLLQNGGFEKPYILVGHSAAGLYFRPFIKEHQEDILGVVLLDASHPNQIFKASPEIKKLMSPPITPTKWMLGFANNTGLIRLLSKDPLIFNSVKNGGVYQGIKFLMEETAKESPEISFGDVPLVVFSAGQAPAMTKDTVLLKKLHDYWDALQSDIARASTNSKRIVSDSANHNSLPYIEGKRILDEILQMIPVQDSTALE